MSNEVGEPDGLPVSPVPGAVRFNDDGRLEIYGEDGWQPLLRVSDADLPPVMREIMLPADPAYGAGADDGDPDRQAPP
jgi:hypothetical protein